MDHSIFVDVWYALAVLILFLYVGLSGIDLGVCLLSLLVPREETEDVLESIDGVWHANQTWLVVLGAVLFGAFPLLYATLLSTLYVPFILLLAMLILRGVALEYREEATGRHPWRVAAGLGALGVVLVLGTILGAMLGGVARTDGVAGTLDFLHPATFPAVLHLLFSALLLGGSWLAGHDAEPDDAAEQMSGNGPRAKTLARDAVVVGALGVLATAWPICLRLLEAAHASARDMLGFYLPLGGVGLVALILLLRSLRRDWDGSPLPWALTLVGTGIAAFFATLHPLVLPPALTAAQAAAPDDSLKFLAGAFALALPPLLVFNAWQYRLFRRRSARSETR